MQDLSVAESLLSADASDLSDDEIRVFKDNPELLDLIGDRETLSLRTLWRVLWIAAALVASSRLFSIHFGDEIDQFVLAIISDLIFEMGAALIGSVATVIFIQHQEKRQFRENIAFREEIQKRMAALG